MGLMDKLKHKRDAARGKAKEGTGKATGDEKLESEGKTDQRSSDLKQAGEKAKDAFER